MIYCGRAGEPWVGVESDERAAGGMRKTKKQQENRGRARVCGMGQEPSEGPRES